MSTKDFITVTEMDIDYDGEACALPGMRLQIRHIVAYKPFTEWREKEQAGSRVFLTDRESYAVKETVEELDALMEAALQGETV